MNVIYDFTGIGKQNVDLVKLKSLIDTSGKLYTGKIYRFYLVNISWSASFLYNMFKPMIPERGR